MHIHNKTSKTSIKRKMNCKRKWFIVIRDSPRLLDVRPWVAKTQYEQVLRKHGMCLNDFLVQISNEYSQLFGCFGWAGISCWRGVGLFVMPHAGAKKTSENDFIGCWYGNLHMYILLRKSWCRFPPLCRGGPPGAKCPVDIFNLVLAFNFTNQELALPEKELKNEFQASFWKGWKQSRKWPSKKRSHILFSCSS